MDKVRNNCIAAWKTTLFVLILSSFWQVPGIAQAVAPQNDLSSNSSAPILSIKPVFERYAAKQGLFSPRIIDLAQDHQGFIWMAAYEKLYRFDGHEFLAFSNDPEDPGSIGAKVIKTVYEDSRNNLWIGTLANGLKLLERETGSFIHFHNEKEGPKDIHSILEDRKGRLWIGAANGLFSFDRATGRFSNHFSKTKNFGHFHVQSLYETKSRHLLVSTTEYGLFIFNRQTEVFRPIPLPWQKQISDPNKIIWTNKVWEDSGGDLWVATLAGLYRMSRDILDRPDQTVSIQTFKADEGRPGFISNNYVKDFLEDQWGNIWIATKKGLNLFDKKTKTFQSFRNEKLNENSLSHDNCTKLYEDKQGNIWVGTYGGGLNRLELNTGVFKRYEYGGRAANGAVFREAGALVEGKNGKIYLGGEDGYLAAFNPSNHRYETVAKITGDSPIVGSRNIYSMCADWRGNIWIGTSRAGVYLYDSSTAAITPLGEKVQGGKQLNAGHIAYLFGDSRGDIWIAANPQGLFRYNSETDSLKYLAPDELNAYAPSYKYATYLAEDLEGNMWIVYPFGRIDRFDHKTGRFQNYYLGSKDSGIAAGQINFIFADTRERIWAGSNKGLYRYNKTNNAFEHFSGLNEWRNENMAVMQEDEQGRFWIGTNRGILRYDPETNKTRLYDHLDGLPTVTYHSNNTAVHKPSRRLLFGSDSDLIVFNPQSFQDNKFIPPVFISKSTFYYDDKRIKPVENAFIDRQSSIVLPHGISVMEFDLAALNFRQEAKNQYKYLLNASSGFFRRKRNDAWFDLKTEHKIRFTNLKPGNYVLHVKGSNNDDVWNEEGARLDIKILPPWWRSDWAYAGYGLIVALIIYGLYRFQLGRQLEKREAQNLRALDAFKNKLYTNITHEFRTPLTVIGGMIEQVEGHEKIKNIIRRNSAGLINLVNQILDLRKVEAGKLKLALIQADVVLYLQYILESYQALAEMKDIQLHFLADEQELWMDFDREKLLRIISNLLSNAIKFTPQGGDIYLKLERSALKQIPGQSLDALKISVADTGPGIPEDKRPFIFDRFYQIDNDSDEASGAQYRYRGPSGGTGVGLALAKELIALMGGRIKLDSQLGKGTTFIIFLPITQQAPELEIDKQSQDSLPNLAEVETEVQANPVIVHDDNDQRLSLLIIEDNPDVTQYLVSLLESSYELHLVRDGREGIDVALEIIPDLIISDVMMPVKDGFEVCGVLKQDERTSHIPIVLLTAKASAESRIQGLERGADAYLAKPFNQQELFVRLKKLAELRKRLRERYQNLDASASSSIDDQPFQQEDAFIAKLRGAVEANLSDADFGTMQLCRAAGMSRSQLHLKIKALTNRSTRGSLHIAWKR